MPRWASRTDETHKPIKAVLEQMDCNVLDLSRVGQGCPDLLVRILGTFFLVEVKRLEGKRAPKAAKLTDEQVKFHARWPVQVLASVDDAIAWVKLVRRLYR